MTIRSLPFLVTIGLFGIGLGFLVSSLDPLIFTEKTRLIAPPTLKNSALSFITGMALLVALVAQPIIGRWSDRTQSRWGKRIPYLVGGVIGLSIALALIAVASSLWLLVVAAMLASATSNTIQGVWQALIPDLVSESQRGMATAIKTILEIVGVLAGLLLAGISIAKGWLWLPPVAAIGLFVTILIITLSVLLRVQPKQSAKSLPQIVISEAPLPLRQRLHSKVKMIARHSAFFLVDCQPHPILVRWY